MKLIKVGKDSGIPLLGLSYLGILHRNNVSLLQIRPLTACNLHCPFCSTDGGPKSKFHQTQFIIDCNYLLDWVKEVVSYYGKIDWAHIDSVGEPLLYPDLIPLIIGLRKMKGIRKISLVTNGSLLTASKITQLEKAGLNKINVSVHSLDPEKSTMLFGSETYDIRRVKNALKALAESSLELWMVPVYLPGVNDKDIEELIVYSKELGCKIGIQKYEIHKFGRKMKGVKKQNYHQFYQQLSVWEKKFDMKLKYGEHDLDVTRVKPLPLKLQQSKDVSVEVKSVGWFKDQYIGVAENRAVTLLKKNVKPGQKVRAKVLESRNNIYLVK